MNNYNNLPEYGYTTAAQLENELSLQAYVARVMRGVYLKMFLGLLVTAVASYFTLSNEAFLTLVYGNKVLFFGIAIAELALVLIISAAINKLSNAMATLLFFLYSALNGVTISYIFAIYSPQSIFLTFCITAGTFGAMSIFGYLTKQDLSKFGAILFMALIGLIVCIIVNIFLASSALDWLISLAGVAIFVGLTAWDTQKIKQMAAMTDEASAGKVATLGALSLYLDFINLFIYLLRIFGSRD
ncbi:MAG: Bax inhibitor-1/YccA family protein [Muribaculaceae bacterium]|nr:Bax inhibitor-1/YccA family protein [Muribaculaceae bacterium]